MSQIISARYSSFTIRKNGLTHLVLRLKPLVYLGVISVISLLAVYIFQIQEITGSRYQFQIYNSKLDALSKKTQALELELGNFSSLDYVSQHFPKGEFVKVQNIVFLPISAGYLASVR